MKLRITVQGVSYEVDVETLDAGESLASPGPTVTPLPVHAPAHTAPPAAAPRAPAAGGGGGGGGAGGKGIKAPMAGVLKKVLVQPGDVIAAQQVVAMMEAMKMDVAVHAAVAGTVKAVLCNADQTVTGEQLLIELE